MLRNNENDMFLHTHLFNNTTKVNRAKRGALRVRMRGAHPMQASPSEKPRKRATYYGTHPQTEYELHPTNTKHVCSIQLKNLVFELLTPAF